MGNDTEATKYQFLYRLTGNDEYFQRLFLACFNTSEMITKDYLRKHSLFFPPEKVYDVAVDAAARLTERIKRRPEYHVRVFRSSLYLEVKFALHNNKIQCWDKELPLIEEHYLIPNPTKEYGEDLRDPLQDILALPNGKKIVMALYRASSYRKAILHIATFVPKRIIYDHAGRLHDIYKHTRLGAWSRRKKEL